MSLKGFLTSWQSKSSTS